jgi:uncharacterized protein (DUF305 family)
MRAKLAGDRNMGKPALPHRLHFAIMVRGRNLSMRRWTHAGAALLVVCITAACSTAASQTPPQSTPQPLPQVTTNAAAIEKARADSIRYPYTEADVQFMTMMVGHHSQAVKIAHWALTHGANPAVQRLAERIINAQQDEIVTMQQWLIDRQKPVPGINDHVHHAMPGMLTDDQLKQLDAARGAEFDRLFLTLMIQHHRGAVAMVKELFTTRGAAQDLLVFKFANDVQVDQTTEVARMEQMLSNLNQRN